ncbi:hypothetical protein Hypma_008614 [Hypsizygus marmoreus]|uniref:DUF5648 domain-containing protein n=1 Tax=Hypsizygus marmoreus TaxID=39966 RepID=A0A369JSG0_HYPMA|nr:hypothetical protein Hypma_008614 [Hypsizygus marmoreus]
MKCRHQTLLFILLSAGISLASPTPSLNPDHRQAARNLGGTFPPCEASRLQEAVPFLRAFNGKTTDHFYTTDAKELATFIRRGYKSDGTSGLLYKSQQPGTVPLYREYDARSTDHIYTTDLGEITVVAKKGLKREGIAGYIYPRQYCGAVPLYRLFNAKARDHLYTTSSEEVESALKDGWTSQGTAGYIFQAK